MAESKTDACWVGFDLGGTKMLGIVYDSEFQQIGRDRKKTKGHLGPEAGLKRIIDVIDESLKKAEVDRGSLGGIGIGVPGPLDLDRGAILETANLGWNNVPLKDQLVDEFGCPVVLLNDVDAGLYGEYRFGAAKGSHCVIGVFPGTGIGGACVYEGKIVRGRVNTCMEIGHIPVLPNGPRSGLGHRGTLEAVASRLAISAAAAQAAFRGQAPNLLKAAGTDLSAIRSGTLAAAIEAGDEAIEQIVRDAAGHIGTAVAAVVNLLAPDVIVLGGGLVEAIPGIFVETVLESANKQALPSFAGSFRVVPAELGDDATVLGAASWAQEIAS